MDSLKLREKPSESDIPSLVSRKSHINGMEEGSLQPFKSCCDLKSKVQNHEKT